VLDTLVHYLQAFFQTVYNVPELVRLMGHVGLPLIIFSETGLMVGFFLPGDSLLVTAGLFAARGDLRIVLLCVSMTLAAIIGNSTGYFVGNRAGHALFKREDSLLFRRQHLLRAQEFYAKHGGAAIFLAQLMPIVRTFTPVVAGAADMDYRRFVTYNVLGAIFWVNSMTLAGYFLGRAIPRLEERIHIVVAIVIFLSLVPALITWLRERRKTA
jgi:membrane-associated protein